MSVSAPDSAPVRPDPAPVLAADEPAVVEVVNPGGTTPLLLICDHASNRIPRSLSNLGLAEETLDRHIAYDIGAAAVTRGLAERLGAPAVLAAYSRLVVDLNRQPGDPTSVPAVSDGVEVPGNAGLGEVDEQARIETFFWPYHHAITNMVAHLWRLGPAPAVFSVHSFTPHLGGRDRYWHIGVLWNRDPRLAVPLLKILGRHPEVHVGDNEPYSGREIAYSIDLHAGAAGLPNGAVEIRQDEIDTDKGVARWVDRLAAAFTEILAIPDLHRVEHY